LLSVVGRFYSALSARGPRRAARRRRDARLRHGHRVASKADLPHDEQCEVVRKTGAVRIDAG
jgi:hypothetical protein